MDWSVVFQLISGLILSVGGAGAILLGMSSYFGSIWANKYLESVKNEYRKDYEYFRTNLELLKSTSMRYSDQQFKFYQTFWESIFELKILADELWESITENNLRNYSKQLKKTINEVEKKSLFLENIHYKELMAILNTFNNYEYGKQKLINLYRRDSVINMDEVTNWINYNRNNKERYETLINSIREDLRNQIRGTPT